MGNVKKKTILIVDDEEGLVDLLTDIFDAEGFEVLTASHGKEALGILAQGERVDLILSDVRMPFCGGVEFLTKLRAGGSKVPLVFMSEFTDLSESEARDLGASALVSKPLNTEYVVSLVKKDLHIT